MIWSMVRPKSVASGPGFACTEVGPLAPGIPCPRLTSPKGSLLLIGFSGYWYRFHPPILPSSHQPNRILRDVPSLPRIIVTVPVIIQPRLLIILLPRQPYHLLQVHRFFLTRQVSPLTIFPHVDKFILNIRSVMPIDCVPCETSSQPIWNIWNMIFYPFFYIFFL